MLDARKDSDSPYSNPFGDRRLIHSIILISTSGFLLFLFYVNQTKTFLPKEITAKIEEIGLYLPIENWVARPYQCSDECVALSDTGIAIEVPVSRFSGSLRKSIGQGSNAVEISHRLSVQEYEKVRGSNVRYVNLVVSRSFQAGVYAKVDDYTVPISVGNQLDLVWSIPVDRLEVNSNIVLFFYLSENWSLFGPSNFPIAILDSSNAHIYSKISQSQSFLQYLGNEWYIYVALLVALLTIVLDFSSPLFHFANMLVAFSLRTYLYSEYINQGPLITIAIVAINILVAYFLLMFCISFFRKSRMHRPIVLILSGIPVAFLSITSFQDNFLLLSDLVSDAGASIMGIVALGVGFYIHRASFGPRRKLAIGIMVISLTCLLVSNAMDFDAILEGSPKNPLQIGHFVFMPLMLLATLIELGSVKSILAQMRISAVRDKEVEDSRAFQAANITSHFEFQSKKFSWQVAHKSLRPLSGDWFDIEEVQIGTKRLVVGCIVDVTGHGLIAAQHLSAVMVAWGQCKEELRESRRGVGKPQIENFLCSTSSSINSALLSIPAGLGASSVLFVLDSDSSELSFISNGHPGVIIDEVAQLKYHTSINSRHGIEHYTDLKVSHLSVSGRKNIFIFSDGFISHDKAPSCSERMVRERFESIRVGEARLDDDATAIRFAIQT